MLMLHFLLASMLNYQKKISI